MSRLSPKRQQGFGLLVFILIISILSLSIVLGYSGLLTRAEAQRRPARLQHYLNDTRQQILNFYAANLEQLDGTSSGNATTVATVLAGANVQLRYGVQAALSKPLATDNGLFYRRLALYFPSDTDASNPPDMQAFAQTGVFQSCVNTQADCEARTYITFDSLTLEKSAYVETQHRLQKVAYKAQAYFKARMLLDPEKNISVNYFRPAFGGCSPGQDDMPCVDTYAAMAVLSAGAWQSQTTLPATLGLTGDELMSAWGDALQASNLQDSVTDGPPFTMVFRVPNPFGGYYTVSAIQQI